MASIVLNGDTSGSVTVSPPAVAGTQTVTLPAASGVLQVSGNMPTFAAYQSSAQTLAATTSTLLQMQTEEWDTAGAFNNTGSTVTLNGISVPAYAFAPPVAGYYQVNSAWSTSLGDTLYITIYKNGTLYKTGTILGGSLGPTVGVTVYLNGTSDYIQSYGWCLGGRTINTGISSTYFQAIMVRSA